MSGASRALKRCLPSTQEIESSLGLELMFARGHILLEAGEAEAAVETFSH